MLQLVYVSSVNPATPADLQAILTVSRANNRRDAITGMLYADNKRFLQALEGPAEMVEAAIARIQADPRHRAIVVLSRREIEAREFGDWEMAHHRPGEDADRFVMRVSELAVGAAASVRATIEGFARVRRAA